MREFLFGIAEITLGMSLLILLMLTLLKLIGGKFTAKCRYILWTLVMIRLAVPLSFGILPALIEVPVEPEPEPVQIQIPVVSYTPIPQEPVTVPPFGKTGGSGSPAGIRNRLPEEGSVPSSCPADVSRTEQSRCVRTAPPQNRSAGHRPVGKRTRGNAFPRSDPLQTRRPVDQGILPAGTLVPLVQPVRPSGGVLQ